jgi:chaperone modulatory protein CbpM
MNANRMVLDAVVVEHEITFTLAELGHACGGERQQLFALVDEGVLQPQRGGPQDAPETWVFDGASLRVARTAVRLVRDLDLNPAGVALVLTLLDRVAALQGRLRRARPE